MILAGDFRDRVTLLRPSLTADGIGGQAEGEPAVLATVFAAVEAVSSRELLRAQQVTATLTHRVRIRVRDVRVSDRARYVRAGVTHELEILQVLPVDLDELHLLCAEVQA